MVQVSHFLIISIDKRNTVLPIDPTILPKNSLFLVLFLRSPKLISIVRYGLSVAHLNPLRIDSFYQIDWSVIGSSRLAIDHTLHSKRMLSWVHSLRYPNLISIVRSEPSVVPLITPNDRFAIAKRIAILPIDPTSLSKRFLSLVPFLRYPDLISLVRYGSSVTLLDIFNR